MLINRPLLANKEGWHSLHRSCSSGWDGYNCGQGPRSSDFGHGWQGGYKQKNGMVKITMP